MALKVYNTLTRKKEDFVPLEEGKAKVYSCGPTVYNYAHIGNLRAYIFADTLRRTLEYNNYEVNHVINITDVGHLTSDSDNGEDKMEAGAKREGKTVWDIAKFYTEAFFADIKSLNIESPKTWCKATDHITEMIDMVKEIEKNGYTYEAGGNLYYDTSKFEHYSELGKLKLESMQSAARTEVDKNKKNPSDFVLWFGLGSSKFGESHTMKWESPWGIGYPGWHIECCAMSSKYLGKQFDIHTGGIDHIPVHHTNEIAQAEAAGSKHPWVKYWMHNNFLVLNKGKMAKSGGNFLRMQTLIDKGYNPIAYRYFCLGSHYKSELNFSWETMDNTQKAFDKFKTRIIELKKNPSSDGSDDVSKYTEKFENGINDDLNIPIAIATAQELLSDKEVSNKAKLGTLLKFDSILGFKIDEMEEQKVEISSELEELLEKRAKARADKDWATADKIRDEFAEKGYVVMDTADGPVLKNK